MAFQKATRRQGKLRLGLTGTSGSGKTYTALRVATGLCAKGKRIAVVDTERGSASLYAGKFDFDVLELQSYKVEAYIAAIRDAERAGYDVIVLDSISHAWAGKDGLLEMVDNLQAHAKNKFGAWREATPLHNEFIDAMLQSPCHIIATMRAKTEYVLEKDEKGNTVPKKVGMAPIQRDGMEYEFTVVGDLDSGNLSVSKTRIEEVVPQRALIRRPGEELGRALAAWLAGNEVAPVTATPARTEAVPHAAAHTAVARAEAVATGAKTPTEAELKAELGRLVAENKAAAKVAPTPAAAPKQDPRIRKRIDAAWKGAQSAGMNLATFRLFAKSVLGAEKPSTDWTGEDVTAVEAALKTTATPMKQAAAAPAA